jgi:hypothetical protein
LKDWTCIYETPHPWQAELIRGMLEEEEIPCVILNKQDTAYLFGQLELYVHPDQAMRARTLIDNQQND